MIEAKTMKQQFIVGGKTFYYEFHLSKSSMALTQHELDELRDKFIQQLFIWKPLRHYFQEVGEAHYLVRILTEKMTFNDQRDKLWPIVYHLFIEKDGMNCRPTFIAISTQTENVPSKLQCVAIQADNLTQEVDNSLCLFESPEKETVPPSNLLQQPGMAAQTSPNENASIANLQLVSNQPVPANAENEPTCEPGNQQESRTIGNGTHIIESVIKKEDTLVFTDNNKKIPVTIVSNSDHVQTSTQHITSIINSEKLSLTDILKSNVPFLIDEDANCGLAMEVMSWIESEEIYIVMDSQSGQVPVGKLTTVESDPAATPDPGSVPALNFVEPDLNTTLDLLQSDPGPAETVLTVQVEASTAGDCESQVSSVESFKSALSEQSKNKSKTKRAHKILPERACKKMKRL